MSIWQLIELLLLQDAHEPAKVSALLSSALEDANLEHLAAALKLPRASAAKPDDPDGFFTGLLHDGTDPAWTPSLYFDPSALDPTNADCSHLEPLEQYPVPLPSADNRSKTTAVDGAETRSVDGAETNASKSAIKRQKRRAAAKEASAPDHHEAAPLDQSEQNGQADPTSPSADPLRENAAESASAPGSPSRDDGTSTEASPSQPAVQNNNEYNAERTAPSSQQSSAPQRLTEPTADVHSAPELGSSVASAAAGDASEAGPQSQDQPSGNSKGWFGSMGSMLSGGWSSTFGRARSTAELPEAASQAAAAEAEGPEWTSKKRKGRRKKPKATLEHASVQAEDPAAASPGEAASPAAAGISAVITLN